MTAETIKLEFPVTVGNVEYSELNLRRPKVRDRRASMKQKGDDSDKEIWLIATLCEVSPDVIDELDAGDYSTIQGKLIGFLSGPQTT